MKKNTTAIVWFRNDLRLTDHPALAYACEHFAQVIPVFIWDPASEGQWAPGAASRWWLHHSLLQLQANLNKRHSRLLIQTGDSQAVIGRLITATGATGVYWNRRYEPAVIGRDSQIKAELHSKQVDCKTFNGLLWREPWDIKTLQGKPYRVFTPLWKAILRDWHYPDIAPLPTVFSEVESNHKSIAVDELQLLPANGWDKSFYAHWAPGEQGALTELDRFIDDGLDAYCDQRDNPSIAGTSRLSAHLHSGDISVRQIIRQLCPDGNPPTGAGKTAFIRQLAWRDFSWHLLFNHPQLPEQGLQEKFSHFPWRKPQDYATDLLAWQQGQTGVPLIDAGMRQLWQTGWMHNRVRMLVASYLTKNLLIPWQQGEQWFWDTLVDADLGCNAQGWQWVAGCGADAAPYFRIFNPVTQGERYDPDGDYVRQWVPELSALKDKRIHAPWMIKPGLLAQLGIQLGRDYPEPLVDLKLSRERALSSYQLVR